MHRFEPLNAGSSCVELCLGAGLHTVGGIRETLVAVAIGHLAEVVGLTEAMIVDALGVRPLAI